jgi:hypothetical protein
VITSSTAAPDLQAICRASLGRDVLSSRPIGTGRNSRVFRVDLAGAQPGCCVVKFYRRDAGDPRDRLGTEFESLEFLWQNGVRAIPRPIAVDCDRQCAIYEYIAGDVPASSALGPDDIDASVDFLAVLRRLCDAPRSDALPAASEACFSLGDIVTGVARRLDRLRSRHGGSDRARLSTWIAGTFEPLLTEVRRWCRDAAGRCGIAFDEPIGREARTLSPSDFGFHNAIRRADGALAFVDFEYFGWDDPAKTIVDYLLHPGMALAESLKRRFAARAQAAFADVPMLSARTRIVYPLFGLKWALILLNDFLPERMPQSTAERRCSQLGKAQALVVRLADEYVRNPYLA